MSLDEFDFVAAQPRVLDVAAYVSAEEQTHGVRIEPCEPVVGARVRGLRVQAGQPIEPAVAALLRRKLLERGFLVFEPGTVDVEGFVQLVSLFGEVRHYGGPFTPAPGEHPLLNTIDSRTKLTRMNYIWHVDGGYKPNPPKMTALLARAVPRHGGDTLFANAVAAYDLLDPPFAAYLETLSAFHSPETVGHLQLSYRDPATLAAQRAKHAPVEAPVIRVHPETGRKQIFANESYTLRIAGVSRIVSQNLLNILFDLMKAPEVQARVRWEQGAALIWDNRSVQHRGVDDFGDGERVLYRAIVD